MNDTVILHLKTDAISIGDRRPVGDLTELIASIGELGLLNPITVNESNALIAGRHRLEACKALGWERIPANVVRMDDLHAELAEIDENLVNNPPGALERGELWARRKVIYEALHPEATAEALRKTALSRGEIISPREDDPKPSVKAAISFSADAAAKTGVSQRTVQQEVQIAEDIIPEVKEMIRDTPVADRKTDLLAIARTPGEQQRMEALARIAQRDQNNDIAYRAQRRAMREEREREEAAAAAEQAMIEARADPKGIFARNETREAYREHLGVVRSFVALDPEILLPALNDADRTYIEAFLPSIRKWCDDVEAVLRPGPRRMRG